MNEQQKKTSHARGERTNVMHSSKPSPVTSTRADDKRLVRVALLSGRGGRRRCLLFWRKLPSIKLRIARGDFQHRRMTFFRNPLVTRLVEMFELRAAGVDAHVLRYVVF